MRTLQDAISCAEDIATKEAGRAHYKNYIRILSSNLKHNRFMIDNLGETVSSNDVQAANIYNLMRFSQSIVQRYGLTSSAIKSKADLEKRVDRAISGLQIEIHLKQAECDRLL